MTGSESASKRILTVLRREYPWLSFADDGSLVEDLTTWQRRRTTDTSRLWDGDDLNLHRVLPVAGIFGQQVAVGLAMAELFRSRSLSKEDVEDKLFLVFEVVDPTGIWVREGHPKGAVDFVEWYIENPSFHAKVQLGELEYILDRIEIENRSLVDFVRGEVEDRMILDEERPTRVFDRYLRARVYDQPLRRMIDRLQNYTIRSWPTTGTEVVTWWQVFWSSLLIGMYRKDLTDGQLEILEELRARDVE